MKITKAKTRESSKPHKLFEFSTIVCLNTSRVLRIILILKSRDREKDNEKYKKILCRNSQKFLRQTFKFIFVTLRCFYNAVFQRKKIIDHYYSSSS